jgi:hypothetical protein
MAVMRVTFNLCVLIPAVVVSNGQLIYHRNATYRIFVDLTVTQLMERTQIRLSLISSVLRIFIFREQKCSKSCLYRNDSCVRCHLSHYIMSFASCSLVFSP